MKKTLLTLGAVSALGVCAYALQPKPIEPTPPVVQEVKALEEDTVVEAPVETETTTTEPQPKIITKTERVIEYVPQIVNTTTTVTVVATPTPPAPIVEPPKPVEPPPAPVAPAVVPQLMGAQSGPVITGVYPNTLKHQLGEQSLQIFGSNIGSKFYPVYAYVDVGGNKTLKLTPTEYLNNDSSFIVNIPSNLNPGVRVDVSGQEQKFYAVTVGKYLMNIPVVD